MHTATDSDYEAFVDAHVGARPHCNVFLATDNADTQALFTSSASRGPRLKACKRILPDAKRLRQTSIADAAVDIFTCAAADGPFKGCVSSSFSDTIARLRQLRGHTHADDEHEYTDADAQLRLTLHSPGGQLVHSAGPHSRSTYDACFRLGARDGERRGEAWRDPVEFRQGKASRVERDGEARRGDCGQPGRNVGLTGGEFGQWQQAVFAQEVAASGPGRPLESLPAPTPIPPAGPSPDMSPVDYIL